MARGLALQRVEGGPGGPSGPRIRSGGAGLLLQLPCGRKYIRGSIFREEWGRDQGMWSGACPPLLPPRGPPRPCTYPSVKAVRRLFPSCTLLATESSFDSQGLKGEGDPVARDQRVLGLPGLSPSPQPCLKQRGCNEKPPSKQASFTSLADQHHTVTRGPARPGRGSPCVREGVCFHTGDVCGNRFRSLACVYLCAYQFRWVYWCE